MTRDEVWDFLSRFFAAELSKRWETLTIGGETIETKYGLSRETCQHHRVGFAPDDVNLFSLLQSDLGLSAEEIRQASGYSLISFPSASPYPVNYFRGRLVFPYLDGGRTIYFSGRQTDLTPANEFAHDAKFLHLNIERAGLKHRPLYLEPKGNGPFFLVEGHTHALRLRQEGFSAIASGGNPNDEHLRILRRVPDLYWIPDVDILAPRPEAFTERDGQRVFVPARSSEQAMTDLLAIMRELPKARLIRYDDDFASRYPKGDQTDWWKEGTSESFLALCHSALTLEQLEVLSIPRDLTAREQAERIESLLSRIAWRSGVEIDAILNGLQVQLDLSKSALRDLQRRLKTLREKGTTPPEQLSDQHTADFREIFPGQWWDGHRLYYTISRRMLLRKTVKGEEITTVKIVPFVVSSDPELFPADEVSLAHRKLFFHPGSEPDPEAKPFWTDDDASYSLGAFMSDPAANTPDTHALYADLRAFFSTYLYHDNPYLYDVLACWVIVSYCHQIFIVAPYLHFVGTRETGKSRGLEIIEACGFNPKKISSASPSYLFRAAELYSPTLLYDEAEHFHSMMKVNDQVSEIMLLWNDGYRKGGAAGRTGGENKDKPREHRTYCPKASANTKGLYATPASRSLVITMKRAPHNTVLPAWAEHVFRPLGQSLRNRLFCWTLAHAHRIAETQNRLTSELSGMLSSIGLRGREHELWLPLFTIGLVVDELSTGRPFVWDPPRGLADYPAIGKTVFGNLLEGQAHLSDYKQRMLLEQDTAPIFLAGLVQMIRENAVAVVRIENDELPASRRDGWRSSKAVTNYLNGLEGLKNWPRKSGNNSLLPVLQNTFEILKPEDKLKFRAPGDRNPRHYFRLDEAKLESVCKDYGVPMDALIEEADKPAASPGQTQEEL